MSAWFGDVKHRIYIAYEITNLTGRQRTAWAHTVLATTDREGNMLLRTPDEIAARLSIPSEPPSGGRPGEASS